MTTKIPAHILERVRYIACEVARYEKQLEETQQSLSALKGKIAAMEALLESAQTVLAEEERLCNRT